MITIDDKEVRIAISDIHDAANILSEYDEMYYEDGLRKAADLITRLTAPTEIDDEEVSHFLRINNHLDDDVVALITRLQTQVRKQANELVFIRAQRKNLRTALKEKNDD